MKVGMFMILDKTSIEKILYTDADAFEPIKINMKDGVYIRTVDGENSFSKDQIGNDSIDLRISDKGYVMKEDYNYINTLSTDSFKEYYQEVYLPQQGYIIKPGELLFVTTYERIALSGNLIGRITGRSVFARMGLSIHCTQDKFSSGINSVAGLQIINNSPVPLKIFPYQKLAQILIERTEKNRHPYNGIYCNEKKYTLPIVTEKDLCQYDEAIKSQIVRQKPKQLKLYKRKKSSFATSICNLSFTAITTISMEIFGIMNNKTGLIVSGVFGVLVAISFFIIDYISDGDNKDYEKRI